MPEMEQIVMKRSDTIIISDNIEYENILSDTFLLLKRTDSIKLILDPERDNTGIKWTFKFNFTEDNMREVGAASSDQKGNNVDFNLNKWFNELWIENIRPWHFFSIDKKDEIFIKVRTTATVNNEFREVKISVWRMKK